MCGFQGKFSNIKNHNETVMVDFSDFALILHSMHPFAIRLQWRKSINVGSYYVYNRLNFRRCIVWILNSILWLHLRLVFYHCICDELLDYPFFLFFSSLYAWVLLVSFYKKILQFKPQTNSLNLIFNFNFFSLVKN